MHPVLLKIGFFQLRSYSALIALGGILSFWFLNKRQKEMGLRGSQDFWLLVNVIAGSGFIGARLVYLLLEVPFNSPHFLRILFAVNIGFSIFGFIAAVLVGVYCYSRILKLDFLRLLDYVCVVIPFWQALGRVGCFMRGCCFGLPSLHCLPWAVTFTNPDAAVPREFLGVPLHPAQLYEAVGDTLLAAFLYAIILRRIEKGRLPRGFVCAVYLAGYGILRFVLEWFRGDARPLFGVITVGQTLAMGLLALSIVFFGIARKHSSNCLQSRTDGNKVAKMLGADASKPN